MLLLQCQSPHRAEADAFSAVNALGLIDDRRAVAGLLQGTDRADTDRWARVVLRTARVIDGQQSVVMIILFFISVVGEEHVMTPQNQSLI